MSEVKTLTVDELVAQLTKFPHDTKIYMSVDSEGNGYGTLSAGSIGHMAEDKTIILYPIQERLDIDDICSKWYEAQE